VLAEILDGGQAFRWNLQPDDTWLGVWSDNIARLRLGSAGGVEWSAPAPLAPRVAAALPAYFALTGGHAAPVDSLPWRSDAHLARCLAEFPGLRILRQPFGETLLGFLCSATKQIVQIKQMVALLATRHGTPIDCRAGSPDPAAPTADAAASGDAALLFHRLPTWPELAQIPEPDLRACLLGFRARYIHQTAQFIAARPGWLDETESLPYAAAKARLLELPGVGEKIADCVLLFGASQLEAFPVDTWILQSLARRYGLTGWKPAQLAQFGRAHFGPLAGLAQQCLFACERRAAQAKL
jgi:N-glycosylase/DNA lyase